ncbi:hypothetical protein EUGRSUZ_F04157 [Eucalyptus grandis]|uniref:Uncharacterized protein n=2 Tax=Eucalyptus grandis TaxID=71139 RepID=A0ACC3KNV1_EUCGR|nr:hypothetical protein EUGRSUZ_F04157 [Eucalyptus grandis]
MGEFTSVKGCFSLTLISRHGVREPRNAWSDGPENIMQCPSPPGTSFLQEINFTTEEGTLYSDWSRATVRGAIIILPAIGTSYSYPRPHAEDTMVLASWFKGDVKAIIMEAPATGGDSNTLDAFTINGQPGDLYNCSSNSTYRVMVDYGKTYLLRIVNAVMNKGMFFRIANHSLTVVWMDAAYLKPIETSSIMITPGQMMDVLMKADQEPSHYYMAGSPFADTTAPFNNTTTTAIQRQLHTPARAHPVNVPKKINKRIFFTVSVNQIYCPNASCAGPNGNRLAASLNNRSFQTPKIDILGAYYWSLPGVYNATFPDKPPYFFNFTGDVGNISLSPCLDTAVKMINYGTAVEIIFKGTNLGAPENQPMHQHGYSFYVVGMGWGNFDKKADPKTRKLVDLPEVNTFGVPKNGLAHD